jgi:hypothetical protein
MGRSMGPDPPASSSSSFAWLSPVFISDKTASATYVGVQERGVNVGVFSERIQQLSPARRL